MEWIPVCTGMTEIEYQMTEVKYQQNQLLPLDYRNFKVIHNEFHILVCLLTNFPGIRPTFPRSEAPLLYFPPEGKKVEQ